MIGSGRGPGSRAGPGFGRARNRSISKGREMRRAMTSGVILCCGIVYGEFVIHVIIKAKFFPRILMEGDGYEILYDLQSVRIFSI